MNKTIPFVKRKLSLNFICFMCANSKLISLYLGNNFFFLLRDLNDINQSSLLPFSIGLLAFSFTFSPCVLFVLYSQIFAYILKKNSHLLFHISLFNFFHYTHLLTCSVYSFCNYKNQILLFSCSFSFLVATFYLYCVVVLSLLLLLQSFCYFQLLSRVS